MTQRGRSAAVPPLPPDSPARRPTFTAAVSLYEQGLSALQHHQFGEAAERFRDVLDRFPQERELNERARLYLALCERETGRTKARQEPRTREECIYAATLALNARELTKARAYLAQVMHEEPDHDGALYMMGVACALAGDAAAAVTYLRRAVARNPENRALALHDSDLEPFLQDPAVRAAIEPLRD
jgi:tetratricopeptide (TPR) repeat protein